MSDATPPLAMLGERIADTSATITGTYPAAVLACPELVLRRRIDKVQEEAGEVIDALNGAVGENPRKGVTCTMEKVVEELLDVALCALGAVEEVIGYTGESVTMMATQQATKHARLVAAIEAAA